jgi:hypothetical protein
VGRTSTDPKTSPVHGELFRSAPTRPLTGEGAYTSAAIASGPTTGGLTSQVTVNHDGSTVDANVQVICVVEILTPAALDVTSSLIS